MSTIRPKRVTIVFDTFGTSEQLEEFWTILKSDLADEHGVENYATATDIHVTFEECQEVDL